LADFQSDSSSKALSELDEDVRNRAILKLVGEVSDAVDNIVESLNPALTSVRAMLGDEAFQRNLSIDSIISDEGDFAVVCRGRDGNQRDVAIKILRRPPISGAVKILKTTAERRQQLRDPGFIRLYDSFIVRSPLGEHLVLVTEYFHEQTLSDAMRNEAMKGRFTADGTVTLIRRAAEALKELHDVERGAASLNEDFRELGYGPMMPKRLFYDERLGRLRFAALSISNFEWEVLGWQIFALHKPEVARYTAPEQVDAQPEEEQIDKRKLDQYMLGQLALEMLEGGLPVVRDAVDDIARKKAEMFDDPLKHAGPWKSTNPHLKQIVSRMMGRKQDRRWQEMGEIVTQLKSVEGEARALAKSSYMKWIDGDERFFEEFYERFFGSEVARSENSASKFQDRAQQHDKLKKGMAAVLNFYPGNEPTSLRYVTEGHRHKGVTEAELKQFKLSFLETLKARLDSGLALGDEMAGRRDAIYQAWQDLFDQVLSYFREQGIHG
jgi:serine/threonine protein kinase